jgi:hypothetical protein
MTFACHSEPREESQRFFVPINGGSSEWHYSIKWKGGDTYGKVPKRIAIARSLPSPVIARSRRRRSNLKGFAKGKKTMPGPGKI